MNKTKLKEGYIAIASNGKYLRNYWSGGSQTGTNKQSLTNDIELATFTHPNMLSLYTTWYNNSHKNQETFTIKKASLIQTIELKIED